MLFRSEMVTVFDLPKGVWKVACELKKKDCEKVYCSESTLFLQLRGCSIPCMRPKELGRLNLAAILVAALLFSGLALGSDRHPSQQIQTYLSRLEGFGFSGVVLVAKNEKILMQSAHGLADREKQVPVRTNTIFDIGSLTKQFTAAAILVLESDGKLRVTDPISKYLKAVPQDKTPITIHQLLTHTSGLTDGFGEDYEKVSRDELVRRAMTSPLMSAPGERHAYSNAGYSLLAVIVEVVSGQVFASFLHDRLFEVAGMTSTGYFLPPEMANRLARGYRDGADWGIGAEKAAASGGDFWNLIGNGGVHSTVGDLNRWMTALQQGKVLNKDALEKFIHPHVVAVPNYRNTNTALYYAYGWYVWKQPSGKTLIWHLGGNGIFNAAVRFHVDDHTVVVYASNVSEFHDPSYPVPAIERMLGGEAVPVPPQVLPLTQHQLTEYAGRYRAASGALLSVEIEASKPYLKIQGEGQEAFLFIVSRKWHKDPALEELNARTAAVVENSRTARYEAMLKAYGPNSTVDSISALETLFWKKRHDRYGDYERTRILGSIPLTSRRFVGRTIVAIDFKRGVVYREYLWTPEDTIGDLGPLTSAPWARYFSESASCFVAFEPAAAEVSRICFARRDKDVIAADIRQGESRVELKKL